ncbi:flagellar basal body P-ring formation chaperone FlgA [Yunchengibacter salinarum]|uniref:flagellar basal body P-ring formation chaperone FlgA n=1 Tax=Yunchengibacter salinarum TaxID=3133399 RepID=UPI0035B6831F
MTREEFQKEAKAFVRRIVAVDADARGRPLPGIVNLLKRALILSAVGVALGFLPTRADAADDTTDAKKAPTQTVTLDQPIRVTASQVTLGDLFSVEGHLADQVVMPAPAPGDKRSLSIYELERIAVSAGLTLTRPAYVARVDIHREGERVDASALEQRLAEEARYEGVDQPVRVSLYGGVRRLYLPAGFDVSSIAFEGLSLSDHGRRLEVTALVPTGPDSVRRLSLTGRYERLTSVPVFNRRIQPGDVITDKDVTWKDIPTRRLRNRVITSQQALVGRTVRRPVQPGQLIASNDVHRPLMVEKGDAVTVRYTVGALRLMATGLALENGAKGELIRVRNSKSNQTMDAKVLAGALVSVSPTENGLPLASR